MPTYVYEFLDTAERTEVRHSIHDDPLDEIDGRPVKRKMSAGIELPAFIGRFTTNENIDRFFATGDPTGL